MVVWWLCWHRTILIRNITQKQYSQFPPVHDFWKPWWGVAYVPCMTNLRALYAWVIWWHVTCMLSLAGHWQGRRALSNHVCAHSVISMWHVVCLQHFARDSSEQSRSTTVLPINHVIQMPQCLPGFVNHDYFIFLKSCFFSNEMSQFIPELKPLFLGGILTFLKYSFHHMCKTFEIDSSKPCITFSPEQFSQLCWWYLLFTVRGLALSLCVAT